MLLFRRQKTKSVTCKGLKISAPFPKQDTRQMRRASEPGTEGSIDVEMWRNPAYEAVCAATPPVPVLCQPNPHDMASMARREPEITSRRVRTVNDRSETGRPRMWSLFRSDSTRSKATNGPTYVFQPSSDSRIIQPISDVTMSDSGRTRKASRITFNQGTTQSSPFRCKQSCPSWGSRLLSKSRSAFNLNQIAKTPSKKRTGPPLRPPRPVGSIGPSMDFGRSSLSFTDLATEEANARIDSYGWQNIQALQGRSGWKSGGTSALHRRESVVSGSFYSTDGEDHESLHRPDTSVDAKTRMEMHRMGAFGAPDGVTSRKATDRKGKTPIRPPIISSEVSTTNSSSNKQARLRLMAVTEEEPEPDYDKPLPAPPHPSGGSKPNTSVLARRKKSQPILTQGVYKPWWEEQGIKDSDLCVEIDDTRYSSVQVQSPCTERDAPSSNDKSGPRSTKPPEKSMPLTEIARAYVEEQERAGDWERQERYSRETGEKRLMMKMAQSPPIVKNENRFGNKNGKGKWRFSVFENEIESRSTTGIESSGSSLEVLETTEDMEAEKAKANASAAASILLLPETEKVKLRPLPLRLNTTRPNQTTISRPLRDLTDDKTTRSAVRHPSALPAPLNTPQETQKVPTQESNIRGEVMCLLDGTPVRSPRLIRRNGEVLLPPKEEEFPSSSPLSPVSPITPTYSSSSSNIWSHDGANHGNEKTEQPDTPPTEDIYQHENPYNGGQGKGDVNADADEESDFLDFYLDQYAAGAAPAVPERSPRRSAVQDSVHAGSSTRNSTHSVGSNPFQDRSDGENEDEERRQWEEEERHQRVAAILGRLRAKSGCPVMET